MSVVDGWMVDGWMWVSQCECVCVLMRYTTNHSIVVLAEGV